jgi:hypothetical protein
VEPSTTAKVGIEWSKGIADQGGPFETYVEAQLSNAKQLPTTAKTFDHFDEATGTAISDKTLNTLSMSYIRNPQGIYGQLKQYVDWSAPLEVVHPFCWSEDHFGWMEPWQGSITSLKRSSPSCGRLKS